MREPARTKVNVTSEPSLDRLQPPACIRSACSNAACESATMLKEIIKK
jgi:hypothetical protein